MILESFLAGSGRERHALKCALSFYTHTWQEPGREVCLLEVISPIFICYCQRRRLYSRNHQHGHQRRNSYIFDFATLSLPMSAYVLLKRHQNRIGHIRKWPLKDNEGSRRWENLQNGHAGLYLLGGEGEGRRIE